MRLVALAFWRLLEPLRLRCETQCYAVLQDRVDLADAREIARDAFIQRFWNYADLPLADRLLHPGTYRRYINIPDADLAALRRRVADRRATILVSPYFASFDLLPTILGLVGVPAVAVYNPHENAAFNAYRHRIRSRGGCELVELGRAGRRVARVLAAGGVAALIADHAGGDDAVDVSFLGVPTTALRSVGALAVRFNAEVWVAGVRRRGAEFRFEVCVAGVVRPPDWSAETDPVRGVTVRYIAAMERLICEHPAQYMWMFPRWGRRRVEGWVGDVAAGRRPGRT